MIAVLLLVGVFVYHVSLHGNQFAALTVLVVGVLTFAAIGITLGGILKAEAAVAGGSLLYLAFSFLGGVFVPRFSFGSGLKLVSQYLPSERMVHAMQAIWIGGGSFHAVGQDLFVMAMWALAAVVIAARRFQWE